MFTRSQIETSKVGMHFIRFQPNAEHKVCRAVKVRGEHVWVSIAGQEGLAKLNNAASRKLVNGDYRVFVVPPPNGD